MNAPDERWQLTVPDEGMPVDFDIVLLPEGNQLIGHLEIIGIPARMNQRRFHNVLGGGHIELTHNEGRRFGVSLLDLGVIQCCADAKILPERVF